MLICDAYAETCIIFDWDDTLLSSSWLAQNGLRLDSPDILPAEAVAQLRVLEESVASLMERALACGNVVIITNAETGWVELSCKKFMPRVQSFLTRVKVLSARSTFESLYPDSPSDWKVRLAPCQTRDNHCTSASWCCATCRSRHSSKRSVTSTGATAPRAVRT
jgi:hypothetical protein